MSMKATRRILEKKGEVDYDYLEDILFFKVKDREYSRSVEMGSLVVDIDEEDFITGIQIFDASQFFGLSKEQLRGVRKWQFKASIEGNRLEIRLVFQVIFRNKIIEPRPIIVEKLDETMPDSKVVCEVS